MRDALSGQEKAGPKANTPRMNRSTTNRALRQGAGLGLATSCVMMNVVTGVSFPRNQHCADLLLAGGIFGLTLCADEERWQTLGKSLAASLLLIGVLDVRGWPVVALWGCVTGLCYLRLERDHNRHPKEDAAAHRNGSARP